MESKNVSGQIIKKKVAKLKFLGKIHVKNKSEINYNIWLLYVLWKFSNFKNGGQNLKNYKSLCEASNYKKLYSK